MSIALLCFFCILIIIFIVYSAIPKIYTYLNGDYHKKDSHLVIEYIYKNPKSAIFIASIFFIGFIYIKFIYNGAESLSIPPEMPIKVIRENDKDKDSYNGIGKHDDSPQFPIEQNSIVNKSSTQCPLNLSTSIPQGGLDDFSKK